MRISSLINAIENGLISATKATGRQARRMSHAVSVELAANRLAEGEHERLRLAERPAIEAFEVQARAEELLSKRSTASLVRELHDLRKALGKRVLDGASIDEIESRATEIESLTRLARAQSVIESSQAVTANVG